MFGVGNAVDTQNAFCDGMFWGTCTYTIILLHDIN